MSEADKMFSNAGYTIMYESDDYIDYHKTNGLEHIFFDKQLNTTTKNDFRQENPIVDFTVEEKQAVLQKEKELGWLDE